MAKTGIYGLTTNYEEARIIYLPVPWEATTSYLSGASRGPQAIFEESNQLDFFHAELGEPNLKTFHWQAFGKQVSTWNREAKILAKKIQAVDGQIEKIKKSKTLASALKKVNSLSEKVNKLVYEKSKSVLKDGKTIAIVGGDHSSPFGAFQAVSETVDSFGILHFDAHSDTRNAYHGFEHSHASIMHNALSKISKLTHLAQVGIRDYCQEEQNFIRSQGKRVSLWTDSMIWDHRSEGKLWSTLTEKIIAPLPNNVWISFDIDGLDPKYCPNTGTPVPGGLEFYEAVSLIRAVARSGRRIIGFDLCEVSPGATPKESNPWNGNVGMRLLYQLSLWTLYSQESRNG